ncbi:MAG TPA: 30S ribosomal protein S5 [Petrotogaceae bacterium]|jgi:small subunit ribosomal protein S5|nr:30S ribosomal protein S5 [Petrotogaceae bacterium]HOG35419.1 30S ribosomal protein S5 [Petrotogaceae bacterium]HOT30853.1 30S ribosomal protein S5 [Petrotogaceae bacterium]HPA93688.1 30S ribosomal protein S5 [Petrotogaceae bacterium]HPO25905.1 30S ribosomal protein S5 [Petrotogaceae bacterium]
MSFSKNVKATDVAKEMEEKIIEIRRVAKVTRGGKTMSFRVVAVVGNKNGKVGVGIGNAREVPQAIRKAIQDAKKNVKEIPIKNGTIPHEVIGRHDSSDVILIPAGPGTGVIASTPVRAVVELCGATNILTKSLGSTTVLNLAKATMNGLEQLKSPLMIAQLRDITVKQIFSGAHKEA